MGTSQKTHRRQAGFTLLELMIVLAVIGIISVIAIPNLQMARKAANEAGAVAYLRSVHTAQSQYHMRYQTYSNDDTALILGGYLQGDAGGANTQTGYQFVIQRLSSSNWEGVATPLDMGRTGDRTFYVDASGVLRQESGGAIADVNSPPIE